MEEKDQLIRHLQEKVTLLEKRLQGDLSGDEHVRELLKEVTVAGGVGLRTPLVPFNAEAPSSPPNQQQGEGLGTGLEKTTWTKAAFDRHTDPGQVARRLGLGVACSVQCPGGLTAVSAPCRRVPWSRGWRSPGSSFLRPGQATLSARASWRPRCARGGGEPGAVRLAKAGAGAPLGRESRLRAASVPFQIHTLSCQVAEGQALLTEKEESARSLQESRLQQVVAAWTAPPPCPVPSRPVPPALGSAFQVPGASRARSLGFRSRKTTNGRWSWPRKQQQRAARRSERENCSSRGW